MLFIYFFFNFFEKNKQKKIPVKTIGSDNDDDEVSVKIIRKPNNFNSSTSLHSIKSQNKLSEIGISTFFFK